MDAHSLIRQRIQQVHSEAGYRGTESALVGNQMLIFIISPVLIPLAIVFAWCIPASCTLMLRNRFGGLLSRRGAIPRLGPAPLSAQRNRPTRAMDLWYYLLVLLYSRTRRCADLKENTHGETSKANAYAPGTGEREIVYRGPFLAHTFFRVFWNRTVSQRTTTSASTYHGRIMNHADRD